MTETPEPAEEPATSPVATLEPPPPPAYYGPTPVAPRPNRLYQAAAWVAIVAGTVFIVSAVFFTGFALGRYSGYSGGWHQRGDDRDSQQFQLRGGPPMMPMMPMMPGSGPSGPMGPGGPNVGPGSGPGFGPGGPGAAGPGATAATRP